MGFQSVDEINHFSFEDCKIHSFQMGAEGIFLEVEALIVRPENSQNTNYTESYADVAQIRFQAGKIVSGLQEGYKYYDANDVLVNEIPDRSLDEREIKAFPKKCDGAYLFAVEPGETTEGLQHYALGFELEKEDVYGSEIADSFQFDVTCEKVIVNWDRYLNRVQR